MSILSRDDILKSEDLSTIKVEVPEWGGQVIVSTMSGFARDQFEATVVGKSGGMNLANVRAKLVASCVVDAKGDLLFTQADIAKLGKKSCKALDRVFDACQKLNGFGQDDIEELAKN